MHIRPATLSDRNKIKILYQEAARHDGGIARLVHEVTDDYIQNFISKSLSTGIILVVENSDEPDQLIGEIHAYKPGIHVFDHLLSELTIVVNPQFQGKKIGRTLFSFFLEEIKQRPDVGKVELIARESNLKAIELYKSLGFTIEGKLERRIKTATGTYEADIPMGWQNPNFKF